MNHAFAQTQHTHIHVAINFTAGIHAGLQVQVQIETKQAAGAVPRQPERQAGHSRHARPAAGVAWLSCNWACRRRACRHRSAAARQGAHVRAVCASLRHPRAEAAFPGPRPARHTQPGRRTARCMCTCAFGHAPKISSGAAPLDPATHSN